MMMASTHNSLEFDDGFEFFDGFAFFDGFTFFDGLTGLCDHSFNSFAGLIDLSLIDGLVHSSLEFFDDFEHFDGLDLTRFLSIFNDPLHWIAAILGGFRCSLPGQRHIVGS